MSGLTYPCCEHCAEDNIHDVPADGHDIPCNASGPCSTRPGSSDHITELLEARATLAKIAAIVADPDAALVVDRIRAALEPTPKGTP